MGFFDKLFGRQDEPEQPRSAQQPYQGRQYNQQPYGQQGQQYGQQYAQQPGQAGQPGQMTDEQAIARYRYMLRTAPPETIEQAHAEAFAQLTPEQRQMVLQELSRNLPEHERSTGQYTDDPQSLARMATRAEMRQPGTMERTFSGIGGGYGYGMGGIGMGGLMAGSFFSSFAGMMIGGMVANAFFGGFGGGGYNDGFAEGYQAGEQNADSTGTIDNNDPGSADVSQDAQGADQYAGSDASANYDAGANDTGMGDYGSSDGGWGDLGGGDFGGGDFGGDFGF
ncbi:MAG: hypothetical protein QOH93_2122 [Chloroflexia bacterium]|jgi:hypothetical protein|nr:hypothetical protein [Chloroflexia bacterium]